MHLRKQMVMRIRGGELNISQASREYGVARNTVKLWLERAEEQGLDNLHELSRRPHRVREGVCQEAVEQLLAFKQAKPYRGAQQIVPILWPDPANRAIGIRTADRILKRHGLTCPRTRPPSRTFEKNTPNELWQADFKGVPAATAYSPLSVLDDHSRFVLALEPLPDHLSCTIFSAFWELFDVYGLPKAILSDNEPCFAELGSKGLSRLEAKLLLLGIVMHHGRPYHPQTQGKVERFHDTLRRELGEKLLQPSIEHARPVFRAYLEEYNYERPHESLGLRPPALAYKPSDRKRPDRMPKHEIPQGAISRKVDASGKFWFKSEMFRAGHGLAGEYVEIREDENGYGAYYAAHRFASLTDLKVAKLS